MQLGAFVRLALIPVRYPWPDTVPLSMKTVSMERSTEIVLEKRVLKLLFLACFIVICLPV